jgi:signal transduction histidine kinase
VVAAIGTAPDVDAAAHAKWSAVVPLADGGSLCVHRRATTPLTATDRALLERTATSLGRLLGAEHVAAELDRTRDLLAHADRLSALGTLSASVAHEIRNPLVSVRTFIQLVPEHLDQIFEPFFSTKDAGSGLGLFIARQIVVAHGGQIRAARRPTGGSEFTIHFPLEPRLADADAV